MVMRLAVVVLSLFFLIPAASFGQNNKLLKQILGEFKRMEERLAALENKMQGQGQFVQGDSGLPKVVEAANKFTVKVTTIIANPFQPQEMTGAHGSGFIVEIGKEEVLIATNLHVVERNNYLVGRKVIVSFFAGEGEQSLEEAEVVFESPITDFALLKVKRSAIDKKVLNVIRAAKFPDAKTAPLKQGSPVVAFGFPGEGNRIATNGVVSSLRQVVGAEDYIQTSAAINPGNSGGPLIDASSGRVIGVNSAKMSNQENTGYAIAIERILKEIERFKENPRYQTDVHLPFAAVSLSMAGMHLAHIKVLEKHFPKLKSRSPKVLLTMGIYPPSDFMPHDAILSVNGLMIGDSFAKLKEKIVEALFADQNLKFEILRGGEIKEIFYKPTFHDEDMRRRKSEYLHLNGYLFQDVTNIGKSVLNVNRDVPLTEGVYFEDLMPQEEESTQELLKKSTEGLLRAVQINFGPKIVLHSLSQLIDIVENLKPSDVLGLDFHQLIRLSVPFLAPLSSYISMSKSNESNFFSHRNQPVDSLMASISWPSSITAYLDHSEGGESEKSSVVNRRLFNQGIAPRASCRGGLITLVNSLD